MNLNELEAILKKLAAYRDSPEGHKLQTERFELYLVMMSIGNLAELGLRIIREWTRHDQW